MAARLGAPLETPGDGATCISHDEFNWTHWQAGRVESCGVFDFCALGSGDGVGGFWGASTLYQTRPGYFATIACN